MRVSTTPGGPANSALNAPATAPELLKALGIDPAQGRVPALIKSHGQTLIQAFAKPDGPFFLCETGDGQTVVQSRGSNVSLPKGFRELAWALARQYPDQALGLLIAAKPHAQDEALQREIQRVCACAVTQSEHFEHNRYPQYALTLAQRFPEHALALLNAVDESLLEPADAAQLREALVQVNQALQRHPVTTTAMTTHTLTAAVTSTTTTLSPAPGPLHAAVKGGNLAAARALLEGGADVHQTEANGLTALHVAAECGPIEMVELLLKHKADVNGKSDTGMTPLLGACKARHTEVAKLLLNAGADVNASTDVGDTALMAAASGEEPGLVSLLLLQGAQVDQANHQRRTALHQACLEGRESNVKILLEGMADVSAKDSQRRTPLDVATAEALNHPERKPIEAMLREHLAKASF